MAGVEGGAVRGGAVRGGAVEGKVAIVTGAGRGLGREHALLLAREGASVVVNDLGGDVHGEGGGLSPAQEVAAEIEAFGGRAVVNGGNVARWADAEALVQQAVDQLGGLDILVNNAGILRDRMFFNMDEAEWDSVIEVHLKGHFAMSRFAAGYWRAQHKATGEQVKAAIVNTTSGSGLWGHAGQANYAAAKAAIASLTLVTARELERAGVRVNAISPLARTRMTEDVPGYERTDDGGLDRLAPANISPLVVWLGSDAAAGVTGQVFRVQGGLIQVFQGWRTISHIDTEGEWTVAEIAARRDELFARSDPGIPPPTPDELV
jgi:NAD(P)-dependent dehydrogenase (short-subunit alcohol dehydrogenase family)